MSDAPAREAWVAFWAGGGRSEGGCLPQAAQSINAAQFAFWDVAARGLPRGGKVLDLGCGDGAVLKFIRQTRADVKLVGVDSSPLLPPAPAGIALRAGIAMENLPFAAGSFSLVTSRFGFEYGDIAASAREVARVLRKAGRLAFLVHHSQSMIVSRNAGRAAALGWAARDSGLLARARAFAAARGTASMATPPSFRAAPGDAAVRFPGQSVAREFAAAILQTLDLGRGHDPSRSREAFDTLEQGAAHELARLAALANAACDEAKIGRVAEALRDAGLTTDAPEIFEEGKGMPFAWQVRGKRH